MKEKKTANRQSRTFIEVCTRKHCITYDKHSIYFHKTNEYLVKHTFSLSGIDELILGQPKAMGRLTDMVISRQYIHK